MGDIVCVASQIPSKDRGHPAAGEGKLEPGPSLGLGQEGLLKAENVLRRI